MGGKKRNGFHSQNPSIAKMEDFLQFIVKCFPIASFLFLVTACTNRSGEMRKVTPPPRGGRQLTRTSTTSSDFSQEEHVSGSEDEDTSHVTTNCPEFVQVSNEDRQVACGNKKTSEAQKDKSEESPDENKKKKEENKAEQEIVLDDQNPHIAFLVASDKHTDLAQMCHHSRLALEHCAAFQWTMKKRLAFDEGCWKHLSRRISAIKAEGFEVRVNTRKARENKANADRETKLDVVFQKLSAGKPKKKAAE